MIESDEQVTNPWIRKDRRGVWGAKVRNFPAYSVSRLRERKRRKKKCRANEFPGLWGAANWRKRGNQDVRYQELREMTLGCCRWKMQWSRVISFFTVWQSSAKVRRVPKGTFFHAMLLCLSRKNGRGKPLPYSEIQRLCWIETPLNCQLSIVNCQLKCS